MLNSELPERSRSHVISQFNEGKYDIIVGSDENNFKDSAPDTASTQPNGSKLVLIVQLCN